MKNSNNSILDTLNIDPNTINDSLESLIDPSFLNKNTQEKEEIETLVTTQAIPKIVMPTPPPIPTLDNITIQEPKENIINESLNNGNFEQNQPVSDFIPLTKNPENPKVEETTKKQETPIQSPSQSTESDNNFDSELIKAFIGKNHHKFSKKFNIAAFFFNTSYLIYRKMYLLGIIGIIAFNVLFYFLPSTNSNQTLTTLGIMLIVLLSFNIIIGFTTNKIYLSFVKKKVFKIKKKMPNASNYELIATVAKKGGTSLSGAYTILSLQLLIPFLVSFLLMFASLSGIYGTLLLNNFGNFFQKDNGIIDNYNQLENSSNSTFDGSFSYNTSVNMNDEFSIGIPTDFTEGIMHDTDYLDYEYDTENGIFSTCSFTFVQVNGYSDAKELANQMHEYYQINEPTALETTSINQINWHNFSYTGSFGTTYYYLMNKEDKVFKLEFEIEEDATTDCLSYKDEIINSIIIK